MNNIINQLSQIEEKTVASLDGAADKKKTLAAEYEAKTKQFDKELNHETELEIQSMRQKMEAEAAAELDRQKTAAGDQIARLEPVSYTHLAMTSIVTSGAGVWGPAMRVGTNNEVVIANVSFDPATDQ